MAATLDCDIVVNVQGDEPLIDPHSITEAVAPFVSDASLQMTTLYRRISTPAELADPNMVKIVVDRAGFAMYFSRSPIPYVGNPRGGYPPLYRHVGLYAYRRSALLVLATLEPTPLERTESLEQLRALEHGIRIKAVETKYDSTWRRYAGRSRTGAPADRGAHDMMRTRERARSSMTNADGQPPSTFS